MKRFHVHLHVTDLAQSVRFYANLFNQPPTRTESDYAKWMLEDPAVNFAISTRGSTPGLDHLGIQVDAADELSALKAQVRRADLAVLNEGETTCCYARSEKHWITDPQGVAWEHFHTLDNIPVFSEAAAPQVSACCAPPPAPSHATSTEPAKAQACCAPAASPTRASGCC